MTIESSINAELERLNLHLLNGEQVECLQDPSRLEEAAGMLADLRDRCGVRLPPPEGTALEGPYLDEDEARNAALRHVSEYPVVALDEMATDESRSTGVGNEFYVTGHRGAAAAVVLAEQDNYTALWLAGEERALDA